MQLEDGSLNGEMQRTLGIANRQGGGCLSCRQGLWTRTTQHAQQHRKLPRRTPETPTLTYPAPWMIDDDLIDYVNNS